MKLQKHEIVSIIKSTEISIVDSQTDFTQLYNSFFSTLFNPKLKMRHLRLLLYFLTIMNKEDNTFSFGKHEIEQYNKYRLTKNFSMMNNARVYLLLKELIDSKLLFRTGRGKYKVSPVHLWASKPYMRQSSVKDVIPDYRNLNGVKQKQLLELNGAIPKISSKSKTYSVEDIMNVVTLLNDNPDILQQI